MTREVVVQPVALSCASVDAALDAVFCADTLREVHGPGTRVGPWVDGARDVAFHVDVDRVPAPIRFLFCGRKMRVTARQRVTASQPDVIRVGSQLVMHFVGSELFAIRPSFMLRGNDGRVTVSGSVRHDARLPWPLAGIAEGFMAAHSERQLLGFKAALRRRGLLAA